MPIVLTCQVCKKHFRVPPSESTNKFCSLQCYWQNMKGKPSTNKGMHQRQSIVLTCTYCKTEFSLPPSKARRSKNPYCSMICMGKDRLKNPDSLPTKEYLVDLYVSQKLSFDQIAEIISATNWTVRRLLKDNDIRLRKCSEWSEASWIHATEDRRQTAHETGKKNGSFLLNRSPEEKMKSAVSGAIAAQTKRGPTGIERKMINELTSSEIAFTFQYEVGKKFLCDFLILNTNLIVECDGTYWHSKTAAKIRDKGKDAYLRKCGYKVLRFTDKEIDNDIKRCVFLIRSEIAQSTVKNP